MFSSLYFFCDLIKAFDCELKIWSDHMHSIFWIFWEFNDWINVRFQICTNIDGYIMRSIIKFLLYFIILYYIIRQKIRWQFQPGHDLFPNYSLLCRQKWKYFSNQNELVMHNLSSWKLILVMKLFIIQAQQCWGFFYVMVKQKTLRVCV